MTCGGAAKGCSMSTMWKTIVNSHRPRGQMLIGKREMCSSIVAIVGTSFTGIYVISYYLRRNGLKCFEAQPTVDYAVGVTYRCSLKIIKISCFVGVRRNDIAGDKAASLKKTRLF